MCAFLWQNIGWFIAGFCIIFGSVYIVAYSSGFLKGLMILFSLSLYSGLLLLCGYQIRLRRPQLYTSSYVSITLGVLLIPVIFTAAVNLLANAESVFHFIVILLISAILIFSSIYVMQFATGLIERSLPKQYNYLFIILAAWQGITPLISQQHWLFLAISHFALVATLIYALKLCNHNWLQDIFLDKHRTSYYLVGSLFYASLVSFIYLTALSKIILPDGYFGLFLIIFCGLFFYIDRSIQSWLRKPAILNHFSFVIYGLSIVAILIAGGQSSWTASIILTLTLICSTALYAAMLWHYLSFPPLYLLLISSGWLYTSLILIHFSYDLHFLLSLPIFYGIDKIYKFALYRESEQLAIICYRFLSSSVIILLVLSLYFSQPSLTAMLTPLIAVAIICKIIPLSELTENKKIAYFNIALITLSAYYTPLLIFKNSILQFSVLLTVLAGFWLFLAIKHKDNPFLLTILVNSLLLSCILSCGLAFQEYGTVFFPGTLLLNGIVLAIISLTLCSRELLYFSLILIGTGSALIKRLYFPVSSGLGSVAIFFILYGTLWFFKRYQLLYQKVNLQKQRLKILGVTTQFYPNKIDTAQRPLELTLYLMWLLGLWRVSHILFATQLSTTGITLIFLTAASTFLITLYSRQAFLLILSIVLSLTGISSLLPSAELIAATNLVAVFVFVSWFVGLYLFNLTSRWLQILRLEKKEDLVDFQKQLSTILHHTLFILASTTLITFSSIVEKLTSYSPLPLLTPLILIAGFFLSAGYYYQQRLHSYFVISVLIFTGLLSYGALFQVGVTTLFGFKYTVIWLLITATTLTALFNFFYFYQKSPVWKLLYSAPLQHCAVICYTLAIAIALLLKIDNFNYGLPFLFLAILSVPLLPTTNDTRLNGFLIPVLLSLAALTGFNSYLFIGWSFVLWLLGYYVFPYLNKIAKKDLVAAEFSAILGLCLIGINFILNSNWLNLTDMAILIACSTTYLCLMLKYPNWQWLRWLVALGIGMTGTTLILNLFSIQVDSEWLIAGFFIAFSIFLFSLYSQQAFFLSLSILLLLGCISYLVPSAEPIAYINLIAVFVLAAWFIGFCLFNFTTRWLQVLTLQDQENLTVFQKQLSKVLHHTLFVLASGSLILFIPVLEQLGSYPVTLLFIPLIALSVFFITAGYYYQQRLHSYFVISSLLLMGLLTYVTLFNLNTAVLFEFNYALVWLLMATAVFTLLFNLLYVYQKSIISQLYATPLQHIAIVSHTLASVVALALKIADFSYSIPFLFLAILYFPLLNKVNNAAVLRGYLIPILLSLAVLTSFNSYLFIGWSFALWILGYYVLPNFNKTIKKDFIAADFSASLGLYLMAINFAVNSTGLNLANMSGLIVFSTVYSCLMLNYSNWLWLRWIVALGINISGIAILLQLFSIQEQLILIYIGIFIWQNLLLIITPCWCRYFAEAKVEIRESLAKPLELYVQILLLAGLVLVSISKTIDAKLILMSVGLNISLLHVLWRYPAAWFLNIVLYSFLRSYLLFLPASLDFYLQITVFALLLQLSYLKFKVSQFSSVLYIWFFCSFVISIGLLLFSNISRIDMPFIINLVLLIYISFKASYQQKTPWLTASYVFMLLLFHSLWLFNADSLIQQLIWAQPYYALQDIALVWLIIWSQNHWSKIAELSGYLTNWLVGLSIVFWLVHTLTLLNQNTIGFNLDNTVAFLYLCALLALVIKSYQAELDKLVYYLAIILAVLGFYLHLCLFGLTGFNLYDAVILLVMSYLLLPLNYKLESRALYRLSFVLPLPALLAVSLWNPAINDSLLLLIVASFYLLLPRRKHENSPIFMALIIFNAGIYLWIPNLAAHYNLVSVYILPASVTSLLMLQLHAVELKPSLYHSIRLLSLMLLYASVSVDIWLNKEMTLLLFVTVLLLTLASIILGIALRIRAFLYSGSIFFMLNVTTQLIYITPENHLTKGIFLFILGGIIFALMIWFQMQREEILQKVRIFRADLLSWE